MSVSMPYGFREKEMCICMLKSDVSSPMELPLGPITRARAKRFQEAVASYIARVWVEGMAEHQVASSNSSMCAILQADLAYASSIELNSV
ncbi:hypothetical protein J1N35_018499 [Gossypium stocksii]|uniref:Uncharacterized protein n=1 Tax=Gossypium stocksii TaxID=47602 RepID=A0A9D3VQG2_9ROSI|nr:hypothetical protein J1N35_018499 [Gossypium stocksii]